MGTIIVAAVLAVIVVLVIASMIRAKKNGKSAHCCDGCGRCKKQ